LDINVPENTQAVWSVQVSDLSTSKWGYGSPLSWASICQFSACCIHYWLRIRHGVDRRTYRQWPSMHRASTMWGRGIKDMPCSCSTHNVFLHSSVYADVCVSVSLLQWLQSLNLMWHDNHVSLMAILQDIPGKPVS